MAGRKEGGTGGEGAGQGGVCCLQSRGLTRSASSWDAASEEPVPSSPASASLSRLSSEPAALLQVFPGRRAGFQASTCLRCRNYVKLITGLPGGSDGKASGEPRSLVFQADSLPSEPSGKLCWQDEGKKEKQGSGNTRCCVEYCCAGLLHLPPDPLSTLLCLALCPQRLY